MEKAITEHGFIPVSAGGKFVEVDNILGDMVMVLHEEVVESIFGIPTEIVRSEMVCELLNNCWEVMEPIQGFINVTHDDGFKPI